MNAKDAWLIAWTRTVLPFAVQAWLGKWRREGRPLREVQLEALDKGALVALAGDRIVRGAPGSGEVFNALAQSVAALSLLPGGFECFGMRFETPPEWLGVPR